MPHLVSAFVSGVTLADQYDGRDVFLRLLPDASDALEKGKGWEVWKKL